MLGTVAVCGVLGVGAAWLVERSSVPGRRLWHVLLVAPLAVPAFVNSYAWISLLPGLDTYAGGFPVVSLAYFPFLYLPIAATFRGLDPAIEDAADGLGAATGRCFAGCSCRSCASPCSAAACSWACTCWPNMAPCNAPLPDLHHGHLRSVRSTFNGPGATCSPACSLLCLVLLLAEIRLRGRRGYARTGRGAARPPRPVVLGSAHRARAGRAGRASSSSRSSCRWAASATG